MANNQYYAKDPDAVLDYQIDWTDWLNGDTIKTSTWTVATGITKVSDSKTTETATIWLSGGTIGTTYQVANCIVTVGSRTDERTLFIEVIQK